jgi:hypothetical protein
MRTFGSGIGGIQGDWRLWWCKKLMKKKVKILHNFVAKKGKNLIM